MTSTAMLPQAAIALRQSSKGDRPRQGATTSPLLTIPQSYGETAHVEGERPVGRNGDKGGEAASSRAAEKSASGGDQQPSGHDGE